MGIGDYFVVPDVAGAADNARSWYAHLVRGLGVAPARATLLRNNEGTREKILARFEAAAGSVEPGGTLWFVFIGHGAPGPKGQRGALVGADAQAEADSLYARSIFQDEVLAIAATGKQARTIIVLEACFSGLTGQGAPIIDGLQPLIPVKTNTETVKGLTVFTAGGAEQWYGWAAIACIGGFFVAGGVGSALLRSEDNTNSAIGTGLFLGGSTIFSTASLVFAVLWLLEKDTVGVDRYDIKASDAGDLDLRIGLAGDGLGLGLEVTW